MKMRHILVILPFTFLVHTSFAQTTTTLSQAIQSALSNRKNIQAGKMDITIQQLKTKALYKKYGPQVSAEYSYNYNPILQSSIIPVGVFNPALPADATDRIQFGTTWAQTAGITASQPLFDASIKKQINENRLQEKISGAAQAQTEYELAYEVAKTYLTIWLQEEQIKAAILDTVRTGISYQLQQDIYTAGRLLKFELNTASINHNNTKQKFMDATLLVVETKIYLLYLTGMLEGEFIDFKIDTSLFYTNLFPDDAKITLDSIPIMKQLNLQKELALIQQQTARAKYIPVVSLKGFLGANQFSNDFNPIQSNSWFGYSYIGLNVKLPILLAEDRKSETQELLLKSQQYSNQLDDKSAQFKQESATAKLELSRTKLQLETQENNIGLYKETVQILQDRFQEQQITASELNRQENELQKLEVDYQNTKANAWLFEIAYLNATGQLTKLWE